MAIAQRKPSKQGASRKSLRTRQTQSIEIDWRPLLRLTAGIAVLGILAQVVTWAVAQLDQPISQVQVNGKLRYIDTLEIERLVGSQVEEGVLTTELRDIQQQVQAHPWVERVSIRRHWPGVLSVWLQERVPVARWGENGLLTADGTIFRPRRDISWMSLPHLRGVDSHVPQVMAQYRKLQQSLDELDIEVTGVEQAARGAWQVELDAGYGVTLYLGQQALEEKIERFKTVYHRQLHERIDEIEKVDLRYSNGLSVFWRVKAPQKEQV